MRKMAGFVIYYVGLRCRVMLGTHRTPKPARDLLAVAPLATLQERETVRHDAPDPVIDPRI